MSENMKQLLCATTFSLLCATHLIGADETYEPLYSGTLLATYAQNTAPGHFSIQPYLSFVRIRGGYDAHWNTTSQGFNIQELYVAFSAGITSFLDVNLNVYGQHTRANGRDSWLYGDTQLLFGTQVLTNQKGKWTPDLRLLIGEIFPTGKYDHLNQKKLGADIGGAGTYSTEFALSMRKIFYTFPKHPFNIAINLYYLISTKTKVEGFNVYQGGSGAAGIANAASGINGVIDPGNQFIVNVSGEYSFTKNWAVGMDTHYVHQDRPKFRGEDVLGTSSFVSSEQVSLAPCLEYNFSQNLSVELATWFTIAGRNANDFVSGTATVFWYF